MFSTLKSMVIYVKGRTSFYGHENELQKKKNSMWEKNNWKNQKLIKNTILHFAKEYSMLLMKEKKI